MRKNTPIEYDVVQKHIKECNLKNVGNASIREIKRLINLIEAETGIKFIRMEMGIPGIKPSEIAVKAEIEAMKEGVAGLYPELEGLPLLKHEISRFIKLFMNIDISSQNCVPTVGSINGAYLSFMVAGRRNMAKDTVLFLDPGFPVHKQLVKMLGLKQESIDVYNYRGDKLYKKLESVLKKGNISCLLYSNPNNPTWICFTEKELEIIGALSKKYDVIPVEDLAYFAMDFRKDLGNPGKPPYQVSVANYTDNYILLISSSKSFSYPGQRIGMLALSEKLSKTEYPELTKYYPSPNFAHALILGTLYATTAGTSHSAQYGLLAMLKQVNDGNASLIEPLKQYGKRAEIVKELFLKNGFQIVYDMDDKEPIADGFYFTISYPGYSGENLVSELIYYGISAISLNNTGSERTEGLRACVSLISDSQIPDLEIRLAKFKENNPL